MKKQCMLAVLILLLASVLANPADWPQYFGPSRNGISTETGLLKSWPASGPKVLWSVSIGNGYSSVSTLQDRIYTMDSRGDEEAVVCLNDANGALLWRTRIDTTFRSGEGDGPRSTPSVDGGIVYALGARGMLVALNRRTGNLIWMHNLPREFGAKIAGWGACSSPILEGNTLIVPVGGSSGNAVMAFNKKDGSLIWKSHTDEPGYSSPILATINGVKQVIVFSGTQVFAVAPADGKLLWKYSWNTDGNVNAAVPVFVPPDKIFISSSYDKGAALIQIQNGVAKEVWVSKVMMNHFNSSILYQNHLYGFDNGILKCIEAQTGKEMWTKGGLGKGALILTDRHLIILTEQGSLISAEANPKQFIQKASAQVMQGRCLTVPSLANGKLYLRSRKALVALSLLQ